MVHNYELECNITSHNSVITLFFCATCSATGKLATEDFRCRRCAQCVLLINKCLEQNLYCIKKRPSSKVAPPKTPLCLYRKYSL